MRWILLLLLFVWGIDSSCPPSFEGLTGTVVLPTDPSFSVEILDANQGVTNGVPCALVFCNSTDDVINAVTLAATYNVTPSARSGRHSYMAYSVLNSSILIDVSQMNEITYLGDNTIKFGAGVRMIEAYNFVTQYNLILPGGTCPSVGISGFILGGGYGFFARNYGLAIDSLVSLDIVLPNGDLVTANETQYSDLFWACRGGGGGNLGVVISLTLTLPQIAENQPLSRFTIKWNGDYQEEIINGWQQYLPSVPAELTLNLMVYHTSIASSGVFIGNASDLLRIILPLLKLGTVLSYNVSAKSYPDLIVDIAGCTNMTQCLQEGRTEPTPTNHGFRGKSRYASEPLSIEGIQTLLSYEQGTLYHNCSGCGVTLAMFDSYGGKINSVLSNWTAFPHRDMLFHMQTLIYWDSTSKSGQQANTWINNFYDTMQNYLSPFAYVNYIDGDLTDWPYAYYGSNLAQLMTLKSKYDPFNLFQFPQSIP